MGKSRMLGAGFAGSSMYNSNPSANTSGGNKKQGLPVSVGLDTWSSRVSRNSSFGSNRHRLVYMNQLGGVGAGRSMFNVGYTHKDGVTTKQTQNTDIVQYSGVNFIAEPIETLPTTNHVFYIQHNTDDLTNNTIIFMFTNPTCISSSQHFIQFGQSNAYAIQVVDNQHLTMTYATFEQYLIDTQVPNHQTLLFVIQNLSYYIYSSTGSVIC